MTITSEMELEAAGKEAAEWGHPRDWPKRELRSPAECFIFEGEDLEALQLRGLQTRFQEIAPKIPVVRDLIERQGVTEITQLNDILLEKKPCL